MIYATVHERSYGHLVRLEVHPPLERVRHQKRFPKENVYRQRVWAKSHGAVVLIRVKRWK